MIISESERTKIIDFPSRMSTIWGLCHKLIILSEISFPVSVAVKLATNFCAINIQVKCLHSHRNVGK